MKTHQVHKKEINEGPGLYLALPLTNEKTFAKKLKLAIDIHKRTASNFLKTSNISPIYSP